jgi:hypothetical protein
MIKKDMKFVHKEAAVSIQISPVQPAIINACIFAASERYKNNPARIVEALAVIQEVDSGIW